MIVRRGFGDIACPMSGLVELRKMQQLEEKNRKLKQLVADLLLDKVMLQDVIRSKRQGLVCLPRITSEHIDGTDRREWARR